MRNRGKDLQGYRGIDGLRAWLAWIVVLSHITQAIQARRILPLEGFIMGGDQAVELFIIISGFVITHLILQKSEDYRTYIIRRFFRLYPAYFLCFAAALITAPAYLNAIEAQPWGRLSPPLAIYAADIVSMRQDRFAHVIAHALMIHGLIPNELLYHANLFFLNPAWSLSLEWQFYLVAPLVIALARRSDGALILSLAALAGYFVYKHGWIGTFDHPSILMGASQLFAIGIATRFFLPRLGVMRHYPAAAMVLLVGCVYLTYKPALYLVVWFALMPYITLESPKDKISCVIKNCLRIILDSKSAIWLGKRSYTVYLVHFPIIQAIVWTCVSARLDYWESFAVVALGTVVLTVLCSDIIYRFVELPCIAFGRSLAKRQAESHALRAASAD